MITRKLVRDRDPVSVLMFGAMRVNQEIDTAPGLIYALERGVNAIDTARAYGNSERILGETLAQWRGPAPFIASKVMPQPGNWRQFCPLEDAFTPESMRADVETSLERLRLEALDLVYLHQWYALWTHRPEWFETFRALKQEGKIRAFGISAQDHEHDALLPVIDHGLVDAVQVIVNIFESRPLTSLVPLCEAKGIGVCARCVLDDGGLAAALSPKDLIKCGGLNPEFHTAYAARTAALTERFCTGGTTLAELAIRFAITHTGVSALTMSMQDPKFVDANIAAAEKGPLDAQTFETIRREFVWSKNFYEPRF